MLKLIYTTAAFLLVIVLVSLAVLANQYVMVGGVQ
jgi:hypothetical protein